MAIGPGAHAHPTTHADVVRVFVYGTLRPGGTCWNQALAGRVASVSATVRIDGLHLIDGPGFPMAVRADDDARVDADGGWASGVVGEVVDVPLTLAPMLLADLDRIEGVPDLFERIDLGGVWVYVTTTGRSVGGASVASGDWFDVAPTARAAWEREMGRDYVGASAGCGP